jgi:precorrin-6Y C5,15-methyltransferase (decarboxylating)
MSERHVLHVIGMGPEGLEGLGWESQQQLDQAQLIAGSAGHLALVQHLPAQKLVLQGSLSTWFAPLRAALQEQSLVLLTSGDPLFFGIGRLLREVFEFDELRFYPHVSSVQLAFSRVKIPWQHAAVVSVHGRSLDPLIQALKRNHTPIAVLTDPQLTPAVIARVLLNLRLPTVYRLWVCSRLGSPEETVNCVFPQAACRQQFADPNVVILEQVGSEPDLSSLPILGLPDHAFHTFADQPGLITKQEVRGLTIALLQLQPQGVIWDVGAGTGSISIEIARLLPQIQVYAIEKNAAGIELIRKNCQRFQVENVHLIAGEAPEVLRDLPPPHRILLGGGGKGIPEILEVAIQRLLPSGRIVGNFATLEACLSAQSFLKDRGWSVQLLQVNLARSVGIAGSTRFSPLNPVIQLIAER